MGGGISGEATTRRYYRLADVASPAAGSDWSQAVPAGHVWDLIAVHAKLTTSAVVANRSVALHIEIGGKLIATVPPYQYVTASLAVDHSWYESAGLYLWATDAIGPLPPRLRLGAGAVISTVTGGIDAGDQWSDVTIFVRESIVMGGPIEIDQLPDLYVGVVEMPGS